MKRTAYEIREDKFEAKLAALAEREDWDAVVKAMDDHDANNERRHREHRADMDTTIVDREPEEGECYRVADMLKLSCDEDWLDIIFSQRAEDLHELVTEYPTCMALKELTFQQKDILLKNAVYGYSTRDLADKAGCTERNIRKQRQKALEQVRENVTGSKKLPPTEKQRG